MSLASIAWMLYKKKVNSTTRNKLTVYSQSTRDIITRIMFFVLILIYLYTLT